MKLNVYSFNGSPHEEPHGDSEAPHPATESWGFDGIGTHQNISSAEATELFCVGNGHPRWLPRMEYTHGVFDHSSNDGVPHRTHEMAHTVTVMPPADPGTTHTRLQLSRVRPMECDAMSTEQGVTNHNIAMPATEPGTTSVEQQISETNTVEPKTTSTERGWDGQV